MTRSFNLPPGCSSNDLPGNDPDECPTCGGLGVIDHPKDINCFVTCPDCAGLGVLNTRSKGDHGDD